MADAGGAWAKVGLDIAAMAAQGTATGMKIDESIQQYTQEISDIGARIGETQTEAARQISQTKTEGIAEITETGRQAAYESGAAVTEAGMTASAAESKLGASGVKRSASPLLAMQQTETLARQAAENTVATGNAAVSFGGLKLGGQMADITASSALTVSEYLRQQSEAQRRKKYLKENKAALVAVATAGGAPGLAQDWFQAATYSPKKTT